MVFPGRPMPMGIAGKNLLKKGERGIAMPAVVE
jgi:hypothetical protein